MDGSASFGYWVRRRRKALDLTQQELAQRTGYALTTIRKIETDARRPSREMAERLADVLELAGEERTMFVQAARAELSVDRLPQAAQSQAQTLVPDALGLTPLAAPMAGHGQAGRVPPFGTATSLFTNIENSTARPNNLTVHPTSLVGREQEVRAVCMALRDSGVRLLTLTGAPGIGKSRIGMHAAAELLDTFEDGVFAVNLTTVNTPLLLLEAIGQTLAVRDQDNQTAFERLKRALRPRRLLLVLDNFERLVEAASVVVDLLAAAPGLKILITSRAALRVSGEHELEIPPLPLPPLDPLPPLGALATHPSVELFVARTRAVRPDFVLTSQNAAAVAAICARLDGLPLAIELAATRGKLFPPQAMLARLQRRLSLLTDGARDLPPHQRTLRSAIGWSYELLSPANQELFARLTVFVGGASLAAIEAVCGAADDLESSALKGLSTLLDNSLLQHVIAADGEPRFVMLETIREFALEQLDVLNEVEPLRRQHAAFFMQLAEDADEQARGAGQLAAIDRLREEHDNLRAALQWSLDRGEADIAVRMSGALGWFWDTHNYLSEGRRWLAAALAIGENVTAVFRARALTSAAVLAGDQNDFGTARQLFDQGLTFYREAGDRLGVAYALSHLGRMLRCQGDHGAAQTSLAESVAMFEELGDRRGTAYAYYNLGRVTYQQGDLEAARRMFAASLAHFRHVGDVWGQALAHCNLGRLAYRQDSLAEAHAFYLQSLAFFEQIGDIWGQALARCKLGWVAYRQGDMAAQTYFAESLRLFHRVQYVEGIADALTGQAVVALRVRQWERAAQLLGMAASLRAIVGDVLQTTDDVDDTQWVEAVRSQLGEAAFAVAWQEGRATPLDQIFVGALDEH